MTHPTNAAAVRDQALEEAAQACTSTILMNTDSYCGATAHSCAERIRALKGSAPAQPVQDETPIYEGGRESVDDAMAVVESFGPGIDGLNDTFARQVILANEVKRLRGLYEQAVQGRADFRNALRLERQSPASGQPAVPSDAEPEWVDAFREFADQHLTDGNGYAPVSTFKACEEAFEKQWPNREAAFAASKAEYDRLHKPAAPVAQPAASAQPLFWYRPRSDSLYEGPIHNASIEETRKLSGAWMPLYAGPQAKMTLPQPLSDLRYHGEFIRGWNQCLRAVQDAQRAKEDL